MRVVITESKIDSIIRKYLDDNYYPDYGWADKEFYKDEFENFDSINFEINDYMVYRIIKVIRGRETMLTIADPDDLDSLFNDKWPPVFVSWFEEHTGLKVDDFRIIR